MSCAKQEIIVIRIAQSVVASPIPNRPKRRWDCCVSRVNIALPFLCEYYLTNILYLLNELYSLAKRNVSIKKSSVILDKDAARPFFLPFFVEIVDNHAAKFIISHIEPVQVVIPSKVVRRSPARRGYLQGSNP